MSDPKEFKPKQGDRVLVRNNNVNVWYERTFICTHKGSHICERKPFDGTCSQWPRMKPLKQQSVRIPYTFDTFPEGLVFVKPEGVDRGLIVASCTAQHIKAIDTTFKYFDYDFLAESCELSIDNCRTWQPASQLVEQTE